MELSSVLEKVVKQAWREVLPGKFASPVAEVMLLAIGLHESAFVYRVQKGNGPARGFWQFEKNGGVLGVLQHASTARYAASLCVLRQVKPTPTEVHRALAEDDLLACGFARLLLYSDPRSLPAIGAEQPAFEYYLRNWRPGAWDRGNEAQRATLRARWGRHYVDAVQAVRSANGNGVVR